MPVRPTVPFTAVIPFGHKTLTKNKLMMNYYKKVSGASSGSRFNVVVLSLFAAMLLMAPGKAFAQTGSVSGVVRDASGEGMIGVNIIVKGTLNGKVTDIGGAFTLSDIDTRNAVLSFSYLGYATQDVPVNGRTTLEVTMEEDINRMDEVVVIGYGSLSRKEVSSSIVQVNKGDFYQGAVGSPMDLMIGKVAGLNVNNRSMADPNYSPSVQIRGAASLYGGNSPLYIIDGVVGGDIRHIASQDIVSMTVLKDGASAAIYGTRGANGVILVTTKNGQGGDPGHRVTYDSWFAVNFAHEGPRVLNADEFRRSLRGADYGYSTDWYSLIMNDFSYDNNQYVSIDGSTEHGGYSASLNYKQAEGLDMNSARKEYGGRFAVNQKMLGRRLDINASLSARKVDENWGDSDQFGNALTMNPTMPVYNPDGSFYHPTSPIGARNPLEQFVSNKSEGHRNYMLGQVEARLTLLRSGNHFLNTSATYAMDYNDLKSMYFTPSTSAESEQGNFMGRASLTYEKWWKNQFEWLLNYTFETEDHTLSAVAGYSYWQDDWERMWMQNNNFAYDSFTWNAIQTGTWLSDGLAKMESGKSRSKVIAVFGRANYSWKNIVMGSASLRYEGSTKFGANNKWGYFPAASVAVEFANMDFMAGTRDVVNSLKPRFSYGLTGRSDFGNYNSLVTYGPVGKDPGNRRYWYLMDGTWVGGYGSTKNPNPNLGWEKAETINFGVDFVLFNRIRGSIDLYQRSSKDILYDYSAPQPPMVYPYIMVNVGSTRNRGFELLLDADIIKQRDFSWTSGLTFSYGSNKIVKLSDLGYQLTYAEFYQKPGVGTSEHLFRYTEGSNVGDFWGYEHAGVDDQGNLLVYDNDGNRIPKGTENVAYKRVIGNGTPKFFYSWNNTLRYKNFDLSIFLRGAGGFDVMNWRRYAQGLQASGSQNVLREAYTKYGNITQDGAILSSFYLEKGDYLKLETITLGYNFTPRNRKYIDGLRAFVSVRNVATITGYSGPDPSIVNVTGLTPGVDETNAYPLATQVSVGLTLTFK